MNTITITATNKVEDGFTLCKASRELPPMKNIGWNVFVFAEDVEFSLVNMPQKIKRQGPEYTWYFSELMVVSPSGKISLPHYYKTINNQTREIIVEKLDFS